MARTRWQSLVAVAVVVTVLAWAVLGLLRGQGVVLPPVAWLVVLVMLVIAGVVLRMGWAVRQFLQGRRPDLDPLRAARTAVLAKASCYTGATLLGWYLAQVLLVIGDLGIESQRDRAVAAAAASLGAVVLAVVGLVVEHLCRVPPPSDDVASDGEPNGTDPAAV
ncbi:DUF3180 domain-containing protein [Cellulomonas sp. ATA003]|uniref:DUF3180 domain-containing protein n=1 Tax=Cellulomonas sp. ATA003 TaxID=3073064 RepID=UPI002873BD28|nr:DUF3180 domain-containing protein [Cellulomonas sp. ATA003]WNB85303.1 DUF3180 domain-containing protein [Cellulomonas sp. ATA003]